MKVEDFLKKYDTPPCFGKYNHGSKECRRCIDGFKCKNESYTK
jgi:hypothetical protein